ncbi:MAG: BACON domain-containing protein [Tidjanibacter sp.]|nr:BACON domain-containing protein [Tidjanibacter sp.]
MNLKKLILFLAAPLALVLNSCETTEPEYTLPMIKVTDASGTELTAVNFGAEGGEQRFTITATREWNITSQADWFAITPISHPNKEMKSVAVEVTLTAAPNEGAARNETIKIAMDKSEVNITVAQAGAGQVALGDVLFYDNFDKGGQAQKGSSGWDTYMDGAGAAYCNPTPENQANVSYAGTKLTVRSNSSNGSGGQHSNYEGSGVNYLWFGTAPTNLTVSGISLANLEGNALTLSFGTERYEYNATDNTFKNDEFHVYISGDGEKWTEVEYSFLEGVNLNGKWNIATSQFNLKEVPETLSIHFTTPVSSAYAIDDLKLTAGGGGAEIDLSQGGAISTGGNTGGNTGGGTTEPDPNAQAITVAEFIEKADTATTYQLTGTISGSINTQYGNFDLVDESGSIYVYGLVDNSGAAINWAAKGLNAGDVITVQGKYFYYEQGSKHEIKDALYISHTDGEGGGTTEPEPPVAGEGDYASDSPFVQATDDSTNAAYGLGNTQIGGQAVTGFKLGKSKQEGKFTSKAIGVSGDKYLNFYAVSWGAGGDKTIYFRVNGGEVMSQDIKANEGAAQNHPYNNLTPTADDHYSVKLTGLSESDVIEFSTNAAFDCAATTDYATRAIFFGVKLTDEALGGTTGGGTTEPEPEPTPDVITATVAEFLAAAEDATVYELTGTIKGTYNTLYGNFYLEDATGEVLIYGILKDGEKCYEALGLKDGDTLTIQGTRTSYNGAAQMKNAEYISHTAGQGGGTTEPEPEPTPDVITATIAEFLAAAESTTQWYELTGKITSIEKADYGNIYIQDETASILIYGLCSTNVEKNDKSFASLGLKVGDTVTLRSLRTSYNGTAQGGGTPPAYYISHESAPVVEPEIPEGAVVASVTFSTLGYANGQSVEGQSIAVDENVSLVFKQAASGNAPAYYDNGSAIRMYQNGATLDVTANGKTITSIEFTFASNMYYIGADSGELSAEGAVRTWTGSATDVKFTSTGTDSKHRAYISAIKVIYE